MAKSITIQLADGAVHEYTSSLFHGYHKIEAKDGICIIEKRLFQQPQVVQCYIRKGVQGINEERCSLCEALNPTQRL